MQSGPLDGPRADLSPLLSSSLMLKGKSGDSAHSHASLELQRNLEALGLSVSRPASPTEAPEPAPEDGRPTTPVTITPSGLALVKEDFEVKAFPNAAAFLEAMQPAVKNWRVNAMLGPAAAIVREEALQLQAAERDIELPSELRIWLGCYDNGRLSIILSKIGKGPVVVASPLDPDAIPQTHVVPTPGGHLNDDTTSPITNVPSVLGPATLARPFASLWLDISPATSGKLHVPSLDSEAATTKPLRAYGYSLTQLPRRIPIPAVSLVDLIVIRLATPTDDIQSLSAMYEEFSKTTPSPVDRHTARKIVKSGIAGENLWIYHMQSVQTPSVELIAGFLMLGSETATSVAIVALFTTDIYRDRGVAEALLRSACRAVFEEPTKSSIVALIPDPGVARRSSPAKEADPDSAFPPTAVRLFARVGFRILDKLEFTYCGVWDGVEVGEDSPTFMQEPFSPSSPSSRAQFSPVSSSDDEDSPSTPTLHAPGLALRRSSERWSELTFEGVTKAEDMRWAYTV